MQPGLDLDLLRTFVEVAETRSFTGAGERLGRVQSAISMQIRRLESITDSRLFSRTPQKAELTAEGERLLTFARRILSLSEEALASVRDDVPQGPIRFGTSDIASPFLPKILARFAAAYPRIELEIECDRSWRLLDALDKGEFDVALVTQNCGRTGGKVLLSEPMKWVYSPAHAVHLQDPVPLALFAKGCIYRDTAIKALDQANRPWRAAYTSANLLSVKAAVSAGIAIAVLSKSMITDGLAVLEIDGDVPTLPPFELSIHVRNDGHSANARRLASALAVDLQAAI